MRDGVAVFRGIPYAAAPVGDRRFRAPEAPSPWSGVRDALAYGPTAPAPEYPDPIRQVLVEYHVPGEDYLNLNVWTPSPGAAGLPVLVWIHGGAFTNGSSAHPAYDGTSFARSGVVTVTFNYRLGVDGYAAIDGAPDNRGVLDQIAALRWVRRNIAAFGGDPDRVTLAGQSAGAIGVCTLLATPAARGLFRRAIAQSGAASTALSADDARRVTHVLAARLGCAPTAAELAARPMATLLQKQREISTEVRNPLSRELFGEQPTRLALGFCPVVDGELLPARPLDAIRDGASADVDLLIGTTAHEYRLYIVPSGTMDAITDGILDAYRAGLGLPPGAAAVYAQSEACNTPGEVLSAMLTDFGFRIPACRLMEARAGASARTFAYRFDWRSPSFGGRLGACHSLEIPFVFGNLAASSLPVQRTGPTELATAMHASWVRFVHDGDPGWPAWNPQARPTMVFDHPERGVCDDPGAETRRLWDGVQ